MDGFPQAVSSGGRLFYLDPSQQNPQIYEFRIGAFSSINGRSPNGFGEDSAGELYILFSNGDVVKITQPSLAERLWRGPIIGFVALATFVSLIAAWVRRQRLRKP